jgi:hypothetical protein
MPSKQVTANTTAQVVLAAEIKNSRYKVTSLTIDNSGGAADHDITIQDVFTPDITNGVSSPTAKAVSRLTIPVIKGDSVTLGEQDLKGVRCAGALGVIAEPSTGTDPGCLISVGYEID